MQGKEPFLGKLDLIIAVLSIGMVLYHVAYARFIFIGPIEHQTIHLTFVLMLALIPVLGNRKKHWPIIVPLIVLSLYVTGYIFFLYPDLQNRIGLNTQLDLYVGALLIFVTFVALTYVMGKVLPVLGVIFILYTFFSNYLPEPFWHFPISLSTAIPVYNIGFSGMYGLFLGISANYIFLFIVFGAFLQASGGGLFFIELGKLLSRRFAGGAGLTSLISAALVGMLMGHGGGSAVTGPFTIPLMKRAGYSPAQAGGIEAVSSALGSTMPPMMGITAFVMAQYLGIPYIKVAAMAVLPAVLKLFCIATFIQLTAMKKGMKPLHGTIDYRILVVTGPLFLIPLIGLVVLLVLGYSLISVSLFCVVATFILAMLRKETRASFSKWVEACVDGAKMGARVGLTCCVIGVIVSSINMTGLGLRLPDVVISLSGGILLLGLLLTLLMETIIGMGVTPLIGYIIGVILVAPALMAMGVSEMSAHFFILYAAVSALITPPVAVSCIVPAAIAGASYMKVAFYSVLAGAVAWLLPFMVVFVPGLILQPQDLVQMTLGILSCFLVIVVLQAALVGHLYKSLNINMRGISLVSAVGFTWYIVSGNLIALGIGVLIGVFLTTGQWKSHKMYSIEGNIRGDV